MDTKLVDSALKAVNSYTGDNIWQDVIHGLDIDYEASEIVDLHNEFSVFVLSDKSIIRWAEFYKIWLYDGEYNPEEWKAWEQTRTHTTARLFRSFEDYRSRCFFQKS